MSTHGGAVSVASSVWGRVSAVANDADALYFFWSLSLTSNLIWGFCLPHIIIQHLQRIQFLDHSWWLNLIPFVFWDFNCLIFNILNLFMFLIRSLLLGLNSWSIIIIDKFSLLLALVHLSQIFINFDICIYVGFFDLILSIWALTTGKLILMTFINQLLLQLILHFNWILRGIV